MPATPRLLFLGPLPEPLTGQALACQVLLEHLQSRYHTDVVNLSRPVLAGGGMETVRRIFEVFALAWQIRRKARDADIVYFTIVESPGGNLKDLLFFLALGRKVRRTVAHLHGGAGMREIMRGRYYPLAPLNRFVLKKLVAMIVLGPRLLDIYSDSVAPERLKVVANFADDGLFRDDAEIARKFDEPGPTRILFLSNLIPGKGHSELLEAFLRLPPESRSRLRLEFAGSFDNVASEQEFRARIADASDVAYRGPLRGEAKIRAFAAAHAFCLPTYYPYEGQPISILEAYASGCAVITTDHSGIFDVFTPQVNGIAVEKRSIESLMAALVAVSDNRDALRTFGLHNAQDARARFRAHHFSSQVEAVLIQSSPHEPGRKVGG